MIALFLLVGMLTIIIRSHRVPEHRRLLFGRRAIKPPIETELGMEAMDMEMVNRVEQENRRLAKKTGSNTFDRSNIYRNSQLPRFRKTGDKNK